MAIGAILSREVHLVEPDETVHAAAQRMADRKVGTLVALDLSRVPVGILTDSGDLVERVLADGLDPRRTTVEEVMTTAPETIREDTPIEDALAFMRRTAHRRLLVVDVHDSLVGVVSLDDVLGPLAEEFAQIWCSPEKQAPPAWV